MDPGAIITLIEYTADVIIYVKGILGAPEGRRKLALVLVQLRGLLSTLVDLTQEVADENWAPILHTLTSGNGPLVIFKTTLEEIASDVCGPNADSKMAKLKAAAKQMRWPFDENKLQEKMDTLERVKSHLILAISCDHLRLSMAIQSDLRSVKDEVTAVHTDMHRLAITSLNPGQRAIVQSLSMFDMSSNLETAEINRLKQGAKSLLQHPRFCAWRDTVDSAFSLLLIGSPGTGKTSFAKVVDYFLKAWFASEPDVCSVSIYFHYRGRQSQSEAAVLSYIVQQMVLQHPYLWCHCSDKFITGGILPVSDSVDIIGRARRDLRQLYLVLDGLDESSGTMMQTVMQRLLSIKPPISLFATSRHYPEVLDVLAEASKLDVLGDLEVDNKMAT